MVLTWAFTYPSASHVVEIIYYEVYDDTGTACEFNFTNEYLEAYLKKAHLNTYLFWKFEEQILEELRYTVIN